MGITESLNGFDWVVVSLVGILGLFGLVRGFTQEALSLAAWIVAAIVVRFFHKPATLWLAPHVGGEGWAAIIGFIGLFFGVVFVARIIAGAAGGYARRSGLGPLDRVLGLGFGALKGVILASILFLLVQFSSIFDAERQPPRWLTESRSAPLLAMTASAMVGWVRDLDSDSTSTSGTMDQGMPFPLPPGAAIPPGHPGIMPPAPDQQGYSRADREALDRVLDEQAAQGQVEI